jgi:hypothetical protein
MKLDGYTGAQNSIRLFDNKEEFLNLELTTNVLRKMKNCEHPSFILNLNFNDFYKGSLDEYLLETYGIADYTIKYELVIADEDDVYSMCESSELKSQTSYKFTKSDINGFENGRGWKYGINVIGSVEIKKDQESVMTLISNKLPLSEEIFKYFIKTNYFLDDIGQRINNVNLDNVNMNLININAVNKTENKIVKIDRPVDNKANIYQTLFYRVVDSISITIHPNVNENVCINLDQYKHLVDRFILQIEGVKFIEIGRIKSGIIFKVIGGRLPKKAQTGKYYILNQDFDMVTSGKYIYEV